MHLKVINKHFSKFYGVKRIPAKNNLSNDS